VPENLTDARLEQEIALAKREFDDAIGDPDETRKAWIRLSSLIAQRNGPPTVDEAPS